MELRLVRERSTSAENFDESIRGEETFLSVLNLEGRSRYFEKAQKPVASVFQVVFKSSVIVLFSLAQ
jgi:hypothetical protein